MDVEALVKMSKKYWDKIDYDLDALNNHPYESIILKLNSNKAKDNLGWYNIWDYKKSIEKTILWYKKYYEENAIMSENDLEEYIKNIKDYEDTKN